MVGPITPIEKNVFFGPIVALIHPHVNQIRKIPVLSRETHPVHTQFHPQSLAEIKNQTQIHGTPHEILT